MAVGAFRYLIQTRSVGADVDGAQAQAATGLDPLLLDAVVVAIAGVDVDAAEAEAKTMTPMAVVVMMEAGRRQRARQRRG